MVRTTGDATALARSVRSVVQGVDPALSAAEVRQMTDILSGTVAEPRVSMLLVSGFAALALVLAVVGIYGVIAYSVSQRTQEIGVRMALGADRGACCSLVIREGLVMALAGVAHRRAGARRRARMRGLLVGVTAHDPIAFAAAALLLVVSPSPPAIFPRAAPRALTRSPRCARSRREKAEGCLLPVVVWWVR